MTYRYRGHSVADAGLAYRTKDEIADRMKSDPIVVLRQQLIAAGVTDAELDKIDAEADATVAQAVTDADAAALPAVERLAAGMYAEGSGEQFARMLPGSPYGERELVFAGGLGS
jgi:pyruvate dehydrogenase E1 component alpha subunit